jgi:hypothetical protein
MSNIKAILSKKKKLEESLPSLQNIPQGYRKPAWYGHKNRYAD